MPQNLDIQLIGRLNRLETLQQYAAATRARFSKNATMRKFSIAPNLVELAIAYARSPNRMAYWLTRQTSAKTITIDLHALLELRADFQAKLADLKIIPQSRTEQVATYLASTACPTTGDLASFAEIHANTARRWLLRMRARGLLLVNATVNEIFCANVPVLTLVTSLQPEEIENQFGAIAFKPNWIKHSIYTTKM